MKTRNKWKKFLLYTFIIVGIMAYIYYLLPILKILFFVPSIEMHVKNASTVMHPEYQAAIKIQSVIEENSNIDSM